MISYVKGKLLLKSDSFIVLETVSGIGFEVFVSPAILSLAPKTGDEFSLYTYMHVKDDGISLFGFKSPEELEIFKLLITVSGIGPKGAMGILSFLSPQELFSAIAAADIKTLSRAPGVGKKTAQRLILELKDKFTGKYALDADFADTQKSPASLGGVKDEALEALVSLGYSQKESLAAINAVYFDGLSAEGIIKRALTALNRF